MGAALNKPGLNLIYKLDFYTKLTKMIQKLVYNLRISQPYKNCRLERILAKFDVKEIGMNMALHTDTLKPPKR